MVKQHTTTEYPSAPSIPTVVSSKVEETSGQDVLGLRNPAERLALAMLDGVTTISPLIRYLTLRSWVIHRYATLGGVNSREAFMRFASKCEAVMAVSKYRSGSAGGNIVGIKKAAASVDVENGVFIASPFTDSTAFNQYGGPSSDLGLSLPITPINQLTQERGLPLAIAVEDLLTNSTVLGKVDVTSERQEFALSDADYLADVFTLEVPTELDRELLLNTVLPAFPSDSELPRMATYGLLMHLANRGINEFDASGVLNAISLMPREQITEVLKPAQVGWMRFLVRDMIVVAHEHAAAGVLDILSQHGGSLSRDELYRQVTEEICSTDLEEDLYSGIEPDMPFSQMMHTLRSACIPNGKDRGLSFWEHPISESNLISYLETKKPTGQRLLVLPICWGLALLRTEPGVGSGVSLDKLSGASRARYGIDAVVSPRIQKWKSSGQSVKEIAAEMALDSLDQHVRTAWIRFQRDPNYRLSARVERDGDSYRYINSIDPGRSSSRLRQAIMWLEQLGLIKDSMLTGEGHDELQKITRILEERKYGSA